MIYFLRLRAGSDSPIKIGYSNDPMVRLSTHRSRYPASEVLGVVDGGPSDERLHHDRWSHLRIGRPEHFRADDDLLAFIASSARPLDSEPPTVAVKIDRALASKARMIATDKPGMTFSAGGWE